MKGGDMNPKLKENLWRIDPAEDAATLIVGGKAFEVPLDPAIAFMKMRPFCTGHRSLSEISSRAGLSETDAAQLLISLRPSGIMMEEREAGSLEAAAVRDAILRIVDCWSLELAASYIGNEIGRGGLSRLVLIGWLLEMYHYIREFPDAIAVAADHAPDALVPLFRRYESEERGHEIYVLRTLTSLGLTRREVEESVPLVSTRAVGLLMKDLFRKEPIALLIVAALVEAQEFNAEAIAGFKQSLTAHYGVPADALDSYFEHQAVDVKLGHAELLRDNLDWLLRLDPARVDDILNDVHDIKHAFDLQSLEIKSYYGDLNGRYFPRQPMTLAAIS
jgi:pyrroloquinoline quinone (PQQ) biosynthesis protein C